MRLWSIHPRYLDPQGLVALWRETLLAQAVLRGDTRGYRNHPQLQRFKEQSEPLAVIALYLQAVHAEAQARGYRFDGSKYEVTTTGLGIPVTQGQIEYEWAHLLEKLRQRNPELHQTWVSTPEPAPHPLFRVHAGGVAPWERP